jgi:hypothetical protein
VKGKAEFRITLYVRFYSDQEKYPLYFIVKTEKYSPIEEEHGEIVVKHKYIPSPFEW